MCGWTLWSGSVEARDGTPDGESPVVQLDDFDSPMLCSEPLGPMQNTFKDQKAEETMWNEKVSDEVAAESTTVRFVGLQQPSYGRWESKLSCKECQRWQKQRLQQPQRPREL